MQAHTMTSALEHGRERVLQSLLSGAADADSPDARLFGVLVAARACRNELALLGLSPRSRRCRPRTRGSSRRCTRC
jgi:nitrogen fixation protein NifQ